MFAKYVLMFVLDFTYKTLIFFLKHFAELRTVVNLLQDNNLPHVS